MESEMMRLVFRFSKIKLITYYSKHDWILMIIFIKVLLKFLALIYQLK